MAETKFRHIVRVVNTDLDGNKPIVQALRKIKGIGFVFANMVCNLSRTDKRLKTGNLAPADIARIESVIKEPQKHGASTWMLNRRKDPASGNDRHLVTSDLDFAKTGDIRIMQKIKSYKGLRHAWRLPVRGQRTKSNFRKNKGKGLGVKKKAAIKK